MKTSLNESEIELVQGSFAQLLAQSQPVGKKFYENLFSAYPDTRFLFKHDMEKQTEKFVTMLAYIVSCLDNIDELDSVLQQLGKRHKAYSVEMNHYESVQGALMTTLRDFLKDEQDVEITLSAWSRFYELISEKMLANQS